MIFLTLDQLLRLHALSIHRYGGSTGVRDVGRLEAVLATQAQEVFGEELYPTLGQKAAVMMRNIIADHPFVDGNKRTAYVLMRLILKENQLDIIVGQSEKYEFVIKAAKGQLTFDNIKGWIEKNIK